jgi:hypothetical protein
MPYAYIEFVRPEWERPGSGHPDHGFNPDHPSQGGPGGRPGWGGGEHPGQGLPGFPGAPGHPGHLPARGRPVDPGYGVEEGSGEAGQLPVWPLDPEHPDTGLPPVPGHPLPPIDPPPGTIWPPLPPSVPAGKALVLVFISGVGYRYAVLTIPEPDTDPDYGVDEEHPDQGLPGGEHPGQGLPGPGQRPPVPGQPLPPTGRPPQPGQGLPGQRPGQRPPTAGQLPGQAPRPPRPQPK